MSKKYKTYDGPGYRRKTRAKKPKSGSGKPAAKGYMATVCYRGISVKRVYIFRGKNAKKNLEAFIRSKKQDTSIDRIDTKEI